MASDVAVVPSQDEVKQPDRPKLKRYDQFLA